MTFERAVLARDGSKRGWVAAVIVACIAVACGKTASSGAADAGDRKPDECAPPSMLCSGKCVSVEDASSNCGACGAACSKGETCSAGTCVAANCPGGETNCGGSCVDLQTNPSNCGDCGNACGVGVSCVAGACAACEPAGHRLCFGTCQDVTSSNTNCGDCGNTCGTNEMCNQGACVPGCQPGFSFCGLGCVDTSNELRCGACDIACKTSEVCNQGTCTCPNDGGHHVLCNGTCIDLDLDGTNCGKCGNICPSGTQCSLGSCVPCTGGFFFCPSLLGDPLVTCRAQAATSASGQSDAAVDDGLRCQCDDCLTELKDCVGDPGCISGWQCAVQKGCTGPCWDAMDVCSMSIGAGIICGRICPSSTGPQGSITRAEALLRCSQTNGCMIRP